MGVLTPIGPDTARQNIDTDLYIRPLPIQISQSVNLDLIFNQSVFGSASI